MGNGKIVVVYGPMFAGKTTYLIKRIKGWKEEGKKVLVVKPRIDDRYGKDKALHSHTGQVTTADLVIELDEIARLPTLVDTSIEWLVIDEAMFFPAEITRTVKEVTKKGINVLLAGLDLDYRRESFGSMQHFLTLADEKVKLEARCADCGIPAIYTRRSVVGQQQIVGAADIYQPVCKTHHTIPVELPYLRKKRKINSHTRIEVMADSMRVGKTTAIQVLSTGLQDLGYEVTANYEDWQNNPFLQKSYTDPARNFLDSQKWFVHRKFEQIMNDNKTGIYLQDVAPEMDYCYAETNRRIGRMSEEHFAEYDRYYRGIDWSQTSAPDLLIYLQVSDEQLLRRAIANKREFEIVDEDYYLMMKKVNREWLAGATHDYRVVAVDTDNFDFAHDEYAKEKLIQIVVDKIKY